MTALPRFDSGVLMDRGVVWGIAGRDLVANLDAGASAWITYPLPDNVTTALSLDDNVLLGSAVAPDGTAAITIRGPQRSVVYYSRGRNASAWTGPVTLSHTTKTPLPTQMAAGDNGRFVIKYHGGTATIDDGHLTVTSWESDGVIVVSQGGAVLQPVPGLKKGLSGTTLAVNRTSVLNGENAGILRVADIGPTSSALATNAGVSDNTAALDGDRLLAATQRCDVDAKTCQIKTWTIPGPVGDATEVEAVQDMPVYDTVTYADHGDRARTHLTTAYADGWWIFDGPAVVRADGRTWSQVGTLPTKPVQATASDTHHAVVWETGPTCNTDPSSEACQAVLGLWTTDDGGHTWTHQRAA